MHTFIFVDVFCVLTGVFTLSVCCAVHILKDEVWWDLLTPQSLAFIHSLVVNRRVQRVLKFLAVATFLDHSLSLLLPTGRHRQEIIWCLFSTNLKGSVLLLLGIGECFISRAIINV